MLELLYAFAGDLDTASVSIKPTQQQVVIEDRQFIDGLTIEIIEHCLIMPGW